MFSIYMGPGRMTNVMTNKSTSISFVPQMPVHQEPVTSLIFHGRAGTKQGTCGTSEWQLTDETTSLKTVGFFFFFFLYRITDGNGTEGFCPWCSLAFATVLLQGAHCVQVNQHVTWMVGLKMHPVF